MAKKAKTKKVSILMPALNEAKKLPLLKKSLDSQTLSPFEIIIAISPKSKDSTKSLAKKYGWKIVKGGLPAFGRNEAAKIAKGELFFFLDSDCRLPCEDWLELAIKEFQKKKLDLAATTQMPYPWSPTHAIGYEILNRAMKTLQYTKFPGAQQGIIFKKSVFKKLKGFNNEIFAEDSEILKRAKKKGYKFRILKSPGPIIANIRKRKAKNLRFAARGVGLNTSRLFGINPPIEYYFEERPFNIIKTLATRKFQ